MTVTIPDVEPVIAALKKRLTDDLPLAVDAVNAAVTDGTLIDLPGDIFDFIPPVETLLNFPTIGIGEGVGRIEDDTGHASTGIHELSVFVFIQADDQQTLVRKLRRTRRAVVNAIMDGRVLKDAADPTKNRAWGVMLKRIIPGPTLGDRESSHIVSWMSWVQVVIECRSDSDWP
jgi:hypothetical protein